MQKDSMVSLNLFLCERGETMKQVETLVPRIREQIVDVPVPRIMAEIGVDVPAPHVMKETLEKGLDIRHQERTGEQIVDVPAQVAKEILEGITDILQKRIPERIVKPRDPGGDPGNLPGTLSERIGGHLCPWRTSKIARWSSQSICVCSRSWWRSCRGSCTFTRSAFLRASRSRQSIVLCVRHDRDP